MNIYLDYYYSYCILLLYYFIKIKKVYLIYQISKKREDDCYVIIY